MQLQAGSKRYDSHWVLRDVSAHIPEGEITCLMGPSGCGKTTLLRLILGLEQPDSGEIQKTEQGCAAVFQENRLFEGFSVAANLAAVLPGRPEGALIAQALAELGLEGQQDKPCASLSGGMKRRVALARAMLAPAQLVLLDEPFSGPDEESKKRAMDFVRIRAQGKTVILVILDLREALAFGPHMFTLTGEGKGAGG